LGQTWLLLAVVAPKKIVTGVIRFQCIPGRFEQVLKVEDVIVIFLSVDDRKLGLAAPLVVPPLRRRRQFLLALVAEVAP
jgi:hypothetical protein